MSVLATAPLRRGTCPGLSAPMPTGDGLLVRLHPTGTISLAAFAALCAAARTHGNGVIEITSRGSIQVRGLSERSAPDFAADFAALGIAADDGVPVLADALAGIGADEIFDAGALAADLRRALAEQPLAAKLGAKISVVIDGGGAIGLAEIPADIRLCEQADNGDVMLGVAVGGDESRAVALGAVALADGVETAAHLLDVIAQRGREARARDIVASEGGGVFRSAISSLLITARPRESGDPELDSRLRGNERKMSSPIGRFRLRDGSLACGIGLAFGHADARSLERLVEAAAAAGASGFRAAAGRTLMAVGLTAEAAPGFVIAAEQLGFIVRADDPRRRVIACAGAPVCASAHIASRALAPLIAAQTECVIHISGCAKGCAHAAPAALTIVGTADGCALVADGSARDAPFAIVPIDELPAAIAKYAREHMSVAGHV
jgi:precorrin-3B synthase